MSLKDHMSSGITWISTSPAQAIFSLYKEAKRTRKKKQQRKTHRIVITPEEFVKAASNILLEVHEVIFLLISKS